MAAAPRKVLQDMSEALLCCKICVEPFDQQARLPRVLPCHHTFCGPCIAKLDKRGQLTCPNCRRVIRVAGAFPVDMTRSALLDYKEELARSPSLPVQKAEMCQKHPDEKIKFYCRVCRTAVCSTCAIKLHMHKDYAGQSIVELQDVLEDVKKEIESLCGELEEIRQTSLQPRAKMAATTLQEMDASFQDAAQEIEDTFNKAFNALLDRKSQALEELRAKVKGDRAELEEQAAVSESLDCGAKTSTALGRTVSSVGLPTQVLVQKQELERAVQEARAEGEKPLLSSPRYKVDADVSGLMSCLHKLGTVLSVTSPNAGIPATAAVTSPHLLTPVFQLEPDRCGAGCTLEADGRTLTNSDSPQSGGCEPSGPRPFAFAGTCGSVDLAQPALHYWSLTCYVDRPGFLVYAGDYCEVGLASLQTLETCGREDRISDHDIQAPTILVVRDGFNFRLEGRCWTRDLDTPQPPVDRRTPYTCLEEARGRDWTLNLGFLYDNRQPQSPCVLVVEPESCRLLGVRRLPPSPPLRPVFRVWPRNSVPFAILDVRLEVKTGAGILSDVTARWLQSLLGRMHK